MNDLQPGTRYTATPRPLSWLARLKGRRDMTFIERDGERYMFIVASNSYRDRENEYITRKALEDTVNRSWDGGAFTSQPLLFWHGGEPIGDVVWADMEGPFLLEVAKQRDTEYARAVWDYVQSNPEVDWGASHGFVYDRKDNDGDGAATYRFIRKFETSILPRSKAANVYTHSGGFPMTTERDQLLEKILSVPDVAKKLRKSARALTGALAAQGKTAKSADADKVAVKGMMEQLSTAVDAFLAKVTDTPAADLKATLMSAIVQALGSAAPAEPVEVEETDGMEIETMADGEEMDIPAEDEKRYGPMLKKAMTLVDELVDNQVAFAEQHLEMKRFMAAVKAQNEALTSKVKALESETLTLKALRAAVNPASRAAATNVNNDDLLRVVKAQQGKTELDQFYGG